MTQVVYQPGFEGERLAVAGIQPYRQAGERPR